jgi:spore germination protein
VSQGALATIISIILYLSSLLGGSSSPSKSVLPSVSAPVSSESAQMNPSSNTASSGIITGSTVVAYDAVGSRQQVAELHRGDYVDIIQREGSWYKIRLSNGEIGYVTAFTLMPTDSKQAADWSRPAGSATVLGYYLNDSRSPSLPRLLANSDVLTAVAPWTWEVTANGKLVAAFDTRDVGSTLKQAGDRGLKTYALIHNFAIDSSGNHTFNSQLVHKLLNNDTARSNLITNIKHTLTDWRMTGVHIDFEMVPASDRALLNEFMQDLYATLHPAGFEVTIAVPSKTRESLSDSWAGAYDYKTLSRYTDQMMLMTYDEHWTGGAPGPVASIPWVENVVKFAIAQGVPAHKLVLGVAGYGYDWPSSGHGRSVTYDRAMSIAKANGAKIQWDAKAKAPYFRYGNGRQVWFENSQSLSHKLELVNRYKLAGISLWRLGQEDPAYWDVLRDML